MASSSSSSTPEDTKIDKILGVTNEGYLLEISLSSGLSRLSIDYNNPNQGCSFSPPVDNRYVYMVGGMNEYVVSADLDVFCFDLVDRTIQRCPPIITPKWEPTLILLGSKLFAFSSYKYFSEHICEVLDTASMSSVWRPLKICPNLPFFNDHLPSHIRNRHICYSVISYATHMNNLFVSLGCVDTSVTLCYNDSNDRWSHFSEMQLPFYGQGKFVDDICYGFPIPPEKSTHGGVITRGGNNYYLASYKLAVNWESFDPKVSCQQVAKYSLSSITPSPYSSLCSFFVSSSNVFTIIREATIPKRHSFDVKKHSLEVDVVQLLSPTMKRRLLAPIKEKKRRLSPPPHCQFNVESYRRPRHFIEESCRLIDVPEVYPYVPPPPETETETVTDDTQDSRLLKHMNILLPHPLGGIVGDYNL